MEVAGVALAAVALLDPTIKAVRKAYGTYQLTKHFGDQSQSVQRRIDGEKARLEQAFAMRLHNQPTAEQLEPLKRDLIDITIHFEACLKDFETIENSDGIPTDSNYNSWLTEQLSALEKPREKSMYRSVRSSLSQKFSSKSKKSLDSSSSRWGGSNVITPIDSTDTPATSRTSQSPISALVHDKDILARARQEAAKAGHLQETGSYYKRFKWAQKRNGFLEHLGEIHTINESVFQTVSLWALQSVHDSQLVPTSRDEVPADLITTRTSLLRLHRALKSQNKKTSQGKPYAISFRILRAWEYAQVKRKIPLDYRQDSIVYPMQVQHPEEATDAPKSLLLVAETLMQPPKPSVSAGTSVVEVALSEALCTLDPDNEEAYKQIAQVPTPETVSDTHRLFQDVSTHWIVQCSLLDLMVNSSRYRSYVKIAVSIALSYSYLAAVGLLNQCPKLSDYAYYRSLEQEPQEIDTVGAVAPFLNASFGSPAPKRSTAAIGGSFGVSLSDNEPMIQLGILLHQIGRWKLLVSTDIATSKTEVKLHRNDLLHSTGMAYTQVVDLCIIAQQQEDGSDEAQADLIYKSVVVPLQRIVDELKWD